MGAQTTQQEPAQTSVTVQHVDALSGSGVDIERAEEDFLELSRRLSHTVPVLDKVESTQTSYRASTVTLDKDLEKGIEGQDEEGFFDWREYLQSSNDAAQAAGLKHKVSVGRFCDGFVSLMVSLMLYRMLVSHGKT